MTDERSIGKDLEGSGRRLLEILCRNLAGGTHENHDKPQCPSQDSKETSLEYKSASLPLHHPVWSIIIIVSSSSVLFPNI
jgi:hypothetical protein